MEALGRVHHGGLWLFVAGDLCAIWCDELQAFWVHLGGLR